MAGKTHTIRRLATGLVLVASVVAFGASASLAGGLPQVASNPGDGWYYRELARAQATSNPGDGWYARVLSGNVASRPSIPVASTPVGIVHATPTSGFHWGDFGIGIGAAIGLMVILTAIVAGVHEARHGRLRST